MPAICIPNVRHNCYQTMLFQTQKGLLLITRRVQRKPDRHSPISNVQHNGTRPVQIGVDDGLDGQRGHGHHGDQIVARVCVEDQP